MPSHACSTQQPHLTHASPPPFVPPYVPTRLCIPRACPGQYYHVLHFPGLAEVRERVGADCLAFFATIKAALPRRCMLDLAWLGDGRVVLIEANAFDGVYGSFPASTGLFSWEGDRALLTGVGGTFEVRVREGPAPRAELLASMSPSWRRILLEK